ncbi:MAG: signal peptidase I [Candidatus Sulfobium sp.]
MGKVKDMSEDLLRNGFGVRISTLGLSMFPLIATGDRIVISPQRDFAIGDLVVFAKSDIMVCHRLAQVFAEDGIEYYRTRGDNCSGTDEPVPSDQIIGKVISIERARVSLARKILLFAYPVLRFARLNSLVVSVLITARNILEGRKPDTEKP